MAPFAQPSAHGCRPRKIPTIADVAGRSMEMANSNSSLADPDEQPCGMGEGTIFALCVFGILFGVLFFLLIWDVASKSGFGWAHRFASCCSNKARNAFTKVKSFAKRRKSEPDGGEPVTVGVGASAKNHGGKAARPLCGPMSDVELVVTPFVVPFTECTGEGACEVNCE
ncbi:hypothetical protein GGI35DRAFT_113745 [Trichoderma velutinum]